jgi:hypothetical protein
MLKNTTFFGQLKMPPHTVFKLGFSGLGIYFNGRALA